MTDGEALWVELVVGGEPRDVDAFYDGGRLAAIEGAPTVARVRRFREPKGLRQVLLAELDAVDTARSYLRNELGSAHPLDQCPAGQTRALLARPIPGAVHGVATEGREGPLKFLVAMAVNPAHEEEYNRWYDAEHIPILMRNEGWLGARRYRCESPVAEYVTIYEVASDRVLTPQARADVRSTKWSRDVLGRAFATHTRLFLEELPRSA
jgi:hypothetical protein